MLTGKIPPVSDVVQMGDRTAIPPYAYDNLRVTVNDMPPIARASWFRGVSAMPNTFAHECYIDELATEAGVDPVEYRLRYLNDPRAVDLVNAVAKRAEWTPRPVWKEPLAEGDVCAAAALPMRSMSTGRFRAKPPPGRHGLPMSPSTRRPAMSASPAWSPGRIPG